MGSIKSVPSTQKPTCHFLTPLNLQRRISLGAPRYGRSYRTVNTLHGSLQKSIREFQYMAIDVLKRGGSQTAVRENIKFRCLCLKALKLSIDQPVKYVSSLSLFAFTDSKSLSFRNEVLRRLDTILFYLKYLYIFRI